MNKSLVLIAKVGPAYSFQASEIEAAHEALDKLDAPREMSGFVLTLKERIEFLGQKLAGEITDTILDILDRSIQ